MRLVIKSNVRMEFYTVRGFLVEWYNHVVMGKLCIILVRDFWLINSGLK